MKYQVLARQFRPQRFSEVVGQQAILTTLRHALISKRIAQAYLFCGCRGTGKTTLARLFAKALNCRHPTPQHEPCNSCPSCKEITGGHSLDVLEIDGASHRGIEDIRQINEAVHFAPVSGNYKIYLIDEVHMLTKEAFNALLKTLEEPPAHVKFFFCTTEPHKIPSTILSRCQRFNLMRLTDEEIVASLEKITAALQLPSVDQEACRLVARLAEGSLRDAQSLFDQVIGFSEGAISAETVRTILGLPDQELFEKLDQGKGKYEIAFEIVDSLFAHGKNLSYFLEELAHHFRRHLLSGCGLAPRPSSAYRKEQLLDILDLLQEAMTQLKSAPSERVYLEMVLLNILRTHDRLNPIEIVQRLEALEHRLSTPTQSSPKKEEVVQSALPSKKPIATTTLEASRAKKAPPEPPPTPPAKKEPAVLPEQTKRSNKQLDVHERGRIDTIMRFAAKELSGTLKAESE